VVVLPSPAPRPAETRPPAPRVEERPRKAAPKPMVKAAPPAPPAVVVAELVEPLPTPPPTPPTLPRPKAPAKLARIAAMLRDRESIATAMVLREIFDRPLSERR
jgi:hypothetical protein